MAFLLSLIFLTISLFVVSPESPSENEVIVPLPSSEQLPKLIENNGPSNNQRLNETEKHQRHHTACHDANNRPQFCKPEFVNAAFNREVEATDTCGLKSPSKYCIRTGEREHHFKITPAQCYVCDATNESLSHPPSFLTDAHEDVQVPTWWQSRTMYEGIQNTRAKEPVKQVNLTLHLGKAFDVAHIRLKFYSARPNSFAIYKKKSDDDEWTPMQYYSLSCSHTYGLPDRAILTRDNESKPLCSSEFSDISPLTGGDVVFVTLADRPSAYDFDDSPVLQDFITATSIRITLDKMNTFGEEIFRDENVLKSYFYGIYDLNVGGFCKCNGHADSCIPKIDAKDQLICNCSHFTTGPDCEQCLPFYNDQPWSRATASNAHECQCKSVCVCKHLSLFKYLLHSQVPVLVRGVRLCFPPESRLSVGRCFACLLETVRGKETVMASRREALGLTFAVNIRSRGKREQDRNVFWGRSEDVWVEKIRPTLTFLTEGIQVAGSSPKSLS